MSILEGRARKQLGGLSPQRAIICRVLEKSSDHPDVEQLHRRARRHDPKISLATVYRALTAFDECGFIIKHDFGDGRARYEVKGKGRHDHLIEVETGNVIEFHDPELEALK